MHFFKLWLALLLAGIGAFAVKHVDHQIRSEPAPPVSSASQSSLAGTASDDPIARNGTASFSVPVTLVIEGDIRGLPPYSGESRDPVVTVHVGGRAIAGTADWDGYRATIPHAAATDVVKVTVQAGAVKYTGWVGSMARLKRLSRGDGVVSNEDAPGLNIGPWTTALAIATRADLGGRDPTSDAEYEHAQEHVRGVDLAWMADLLERYANGVPSPPTGFATGFDVALDPDTLRAELSRLGLTGPLPKNSVRVVLATAPLAPVADLDALPATLLARHARVRGELPINSAVVSLVREGAGRHAMYQSGSTMNALYASGMDYGGAIGMTPLVPQVFTSYGPKWFDPYSWVRIDRTTDYIRWQRLTDGEEVDLWAIFHDQTETYPDHPGESSEVLKSVQIVTVRDFASVVRPAGWAGLEGQRRTLPIMCVRPFATRLTLEACDTAVHRFDVGGTGVTEDVGLKVNARMTPQAGGFGVAFNWTRHGDGSLEVRYPDGAITRAWVTDSEPGLDAIVVRTSLAVDGVTYAGNDSVLSIVATTVPFSTPQAAGTWQSGLREAFPVGYPGDPRTFQIARNAGGTGEQVEATLDYSLRYPQTWSILGERIYDIRTNARFSSTGSGTQPVNDCATAFAQGALSCAPMYVRYLRPLRRVGNRIYGIEEVHMQGKLKSQSDTSPYTDISSITRSSYQRCVAGECLGYAHVPAFAQALQSIGAPALSPGGVEPRETRRRRRTGSRLQR